MFQVLNALRRVTGAITLLLVWPGLSAAQTRVPSQSAFRKLVLTERYYCDGITAGDINGDEYLDIVAGPFWYEGPTFEQAHEFYEAVPLDPAPSPSNSMFSFIHDFDADGRNDILVLGRVHKHPAIWYQNTGKFDEWWPSHQVFERIRGESPQLCELFPERPPQLLTHWEGRWGFVHPDPAQPYAPWQFHAIGEDEDWPQFYHGQGIGDVNGDNRADVILNDGWYEQPADAPHTEPWNFHRGRFSTERGGAQMFADDVDGDGDQDIISALHAHEWGIAWFEQLSGTADASAPEIRTVGERGFRQHLIIHDRSGEAEFGAAFSQPHALALADLNGDGHKDIVCGKRLWAHGPEGDVEPNAAPVLYWFEWSQTQDGEIRFIPHLIDDASGVGVQLTVTDVNADGRPDILTVSKLGTFVFLNELP